MHLHTPWNASVISCIPQMLLLPTEIQISPNLQSENKHQELKCSTYISVIMNLWHILVCIWHWELHGKAIIGHMTPCWEKEHSKQLHWKQTLHPLYLRPFVSYNIWNQWLTYSIATSRVYVQKHLTCSMLLAGNWKEKHTCWALKVSKS